MADSVLIDRLCRRITLHDRTWFGRIVRRHPEMRGRRDLAERAIGHPIEIRHSTSDVDCRTYYGSGPRPDIMVAIVADVVQGFVKTGYLTNRPRGVVE